MKRTWHYLTSAVCGGLFLALCLQAPSLIAAALPRAQQAPEIASEEIPQLEAIYAALSETRAALTKAETLFVEYVVARMPAAPVDPDPIPGPVTPEPEPEPEPGPIVDGSARARAFEIAAEARSVVAASFAALAPEEEREGVQAAFELALLGNYESFDSKWNGVRVMLAQAGGTWTARAGDAAPVDVGGKALARAVQMAGPWGIVEVDPATLTAVPGGLMGLEAWNGGVVSHVGPVLIRGARLESIASAGGKDKGAPALWVDRCTFAAGVANKSPVQVYIGMENGRPMSFSRCTWSSSVPEHNGWNGHPHQWGLRLYPQGPIAVVDSVFEPHWAEHNGYLSNVQGAGYIARNSNSESPRTTWQVTNRIPEGLPSFGPIAFEELQIVMPRKLQNTAGGGHSITVAGHLGPIAVRDIRWSTAASKRPWDSMAGALLFWLEPKTANGGAHVGADGWGIPEVAVSGLSIGLEGETLPYLVDREPIMLVGVRHVRFDARGEALVPIQGFGGVSSQARTLSVNHLGVDPSPGYRYELGLLSWEDAPEAPAPWWTVRGKTWATTLPPRPPTGAFGPLSVISTPSPDPIQPIDPTRTQAPSGGG